MAIVRYKCHTTHKVKVSDHDELNRPNTLATHFYKEITQTVGTIITSGDTQYKCIAEHKYWQNEDAYIVSSQSYQAGTKVTVGQTFEADNGTYTCIKAFWYWTAWTDFRVSKGNNEYFTYAANDPFRDYKIVFKVLVRGDHSMINSVSTLASKFQKIKSEVEFPDSSGFILDNKNGKFYMLRKDYSIINTDPSQQPSFLEVFSAFLSKNGTGYRRWYYFREADQEEVLELTPENNNYAGMVNTYNPNKRLLLPNPLPEECEYIAITY